MMRPSNTVNATIMIFVFYRTARENIVQSVLTPGNMNTELAMHASVHVVFVKEAV